MTTPFLPGTPLVIHHEDHTHEMIWPMGLPIPRWGDDFTFQGGEYHIASGGWTLETVQVEGAPEGAVAAAINYHIYLEDLDEDDHNSLEPGVLPPMRRV